MTNPPYLDSEAITAALSPGEAVEAIARTLTEGFDPAEDTPRINTGTSHGHFLLMPTEAGAYAGIKVATVAPRNHERGLPRIQASYLLHDAETLALLAILDGTALTTLRTPAVSAAAVRPLLDRLPDQRRLVVFGAGPQAIAHVDTLAAIAPEPFSSVTFAVRNPERCEDAVRARGRLTRTGTPEAASALAAADLIVCATTARTPLFDGDSIAAHAVVIAVGSHEPDARELDGTLLARASVIVEDRAAALREAGDVMIAVREGSIDPVDLVPMRDVVLGRVSLPTDRPIVFKSVGMSWEDLSIARAAHDRTRATADRPA